MPQGRPEEAALDAGGPLRPGKDQPDQGEPKGDEASASTPGEAVAEQAPCPPPFASKPPWRWLRRPRPYPPVAGYGVRWVVLASSRKLA